MAVYDNLPSTPGGWPGPSTAGAQYVALVQVAYEQTMRLLMQQFESKAAKRAARQINVRGSETRVGRWGKATLQQGARASFIGNDVTGGVSSAETPASTRVLRAAHWRYPEFFDTRDEVGLQTLISALTDGAYKQNVMGAMNRKADSVFFTAMDATVTLGDGAGTETFAASGGTEVNRLMKADGSAAALTTRMHHRKLLGLLNALQLNDAFAGPSETFLALHPYQLFQLFVESGTPLTSSDYNSLRPLMSGDVSSYLGMEWIMSTEIPAITDIDTATAGEGGGHAVFAWNKSAMVNGYGQPRNWVKDVPLRGDTVLVYQGAFFGALRNDGTGVAMVVCEDDFTMAIT